MRKGGNDNGGEVYVIAGLTIDVPRATISRTIDGTTVSLRTKCFDALVFFLRNPDRVITRDELMEAVWKGTFVSADTIAGCVAEVRDALTEGGESSELILTHRGRGYRLPSGTFRQLASEPPSPVPAPPHRHWRRYLAGAGVSVLLAVAMLPHDPRPPVQSVVREAAWWKFDEPGAEIVLDSSGNRNSGRLIGGARRIPGVLGRAIEFDGIDGRTVGESTGNSFPFGASPRTIACWIRTAAPPVEDAGIFHYGLVDVTKAATNFHLFIDRQGRIGFGNGYNHGVIRSSKSVADGQWHHISADLLEYPERMCGLFIDGALDAADRIAVAPITTPGTRWTIGVFMGGGVPFKGAIDDVRLFPARLDAQQRQALWTCSSPSLAVHEGGGGSRKWFLLPLAGSMAFSGYGTEPARLVLSAYSEGLSCVQFADFDATCGVESFRGAEFPSGIRLAADVSFPATIARSDALAGPYFGARPGRLGSKTPDETGGTWVAINAQGEAELRPLAARSTTAARLLSASARTGAADRTYHVEVVIRGVGGTVRVNDAAADFTLPAALGSAAGFAFFQPSPPLFTQLPTIRNVEASAGR